MSGVKSISHELYEQAASIDRQAWDHVFCMAGGGGLTLAVSLQVIDGNEVIAACRCNGGTGYLVDDNFVWEVQSRLASEEGIFAEPAGSMAVAGALQAAREGNLDPDANVVCLITGSAFKDPPSLDAMVRNFSAPMIELQDLQRRVAEVC